MAQLEWRNVSYTYPGQQSAALREITISIEEGAFIVFCGASGSGKSTLLKLLKPELLPAGITQGDIVFFEKPLLSYSQLELSQSLGMVMQNPENQIVMDRVREELYFSMENIGVPPLQMRKRLAEIAQVFGLEDILAKSTMELSGGQRQLINLASVLVLQPKVLLLDEPTAQLDPVAAREFLQLVKHINVEFGITVLMAEHRLEDIWLLADRIYLLNEGEIIFSDSPSHMFKTEAKQLEKYLPAVARVFQVLQLEDASYTNIKEAKRKFAAWLSEQGIARSNQQQNVTQVDQNKPKQALLSCKGIYQQYAKKLDPVLQNISIDIAKGDFLALFGANGSGKTTLLQVMCGLLKPQSGKVLFENKEILRIEEKLRYTHFGYLAQNPMLNFTEDNVENELIAAAERAKRMGVEVRVADFINEFDLAGLMAKHPYDVSGGEKQKLALACILMNNPKILFLDEPTKGLDPASKLVLSKRLKLEQAKGTAIIMVSHDLEFAAAYSSRCVMLFDGKIVADAEPAAFFSENYFYTTAVNRLVRDWFPHALTVEDVVKLCGVKESS